MWQEIAYMLNFGLQTVDEIEERNKGKPAHLAAFRMLTKWKEGCHGDTQQKKQMLTEIIINAMSLSIIDDDILDLLIWVRGH